MNSNPLLQDLLNFLNQSPTAWHAAANAVNLLKKYHFIELHENENWDLSPGKRYYVTRNNSSFCAFIVPHSTPKAAKIIGSHTDSPALKLKPLPEIRKQNMILFGVEIYGAPLLTSWLNRDLGIAGRVTYIPKKGNTVQQTLINLDEAPLTIPQLAIHLDREVNEKGLILNKQDHLNALLAIENAAPQPYLESLITRKIGLKEIISSDLFLYPLEPARLIGADHAFLAAYRLDNLVSLHASLRALLKHPEPHQSDLKMIVSWDNEEIGSNTSQGAGSPFLQQILERILISFKKGRSDYFSLLNRSLCVSVDLGHASHPNYPEKHDAQHQTLMGKGIILKNNAQQRYASDARSALPVLMVAKEHGLPLQRYVNRNDIPCGSTIGPIHASLSGMPTVDIGIGILSMHSSREIMACQDHLYLCEFLEHLLTTMP